MPQNGMSYEGRRGGMRHNICKANDQVPGTGLVNGAVAYNGWPPAATRTSESTPAGTAGTKPQGMVNGYINRGYKGKSTKAAPPRTCMKHGSRISAVTDATAAGRVCSTGAPGGVSVNGAASLDTVASLYNSEQMAPQHSLSATAKNKRRREKFRRKKRNTEVDWPEDPTLSLLPTQKEEDWESEVQEVTLTDWEKIRFGISPYGPEDVLHFSLRDLTLKQRGIVDLPRAASYHPAMHHQLPVQWFCCRFPTEPDQFADADDAADAAGGRLRAALSMVSPTMKALVDAVWVVWSIGASVYDYIHTNAMEERIHALEDVITIHQCVIGLLSAGVLVLFTYILFKKL